MMRPTALALSLAIGLCAARASAQDNAAFAQQRYMRGTTLYEQRDYTHALDEFRASLELYGSPNTRLYAARSLRELGRLDEAVTEYERAMREAADRAATDPRYADTREHAHAEMVVLEPRIARLTVSVAEMPQNVVVRVNNRELPSAAVGVPMAVMPGHLEIVTQARGFHADRREVDLEAGHQAAVTVTLRRRTTLEGIDENPTGGAGEPSGAAPAGASRGGVPRVVPWVVMGVGVAGLAAFAVTGLMASGAYDTLETRCGGVRCPVDEQGAVDDGRTLQTVANVSLGIGLAGLATGAVLMAFRRPAERAPAPPVQVSLGPRGVLLGGSF